MDKLSESIAESIIEDVSFTEDMWIHLDEIARDYALGLPLNDEEAMLTMREILRDWFVEVTLILQYKDEMFVCANKQCKRRFFPTRSDAQYCSAACRQARFRQRRAEIDG